MSTSRRIFRRLAFAVIALFALALGMRDVINSSTFQLFGNYVVRVETNERVVALTFDDGPHPRFTPRVLDLLDSYGVRATFFMMGRNIERWPDTAREVLRRGHEVGNHSYSHPKLIFMSPSRVRAEITRTDALLRQIGASGEIRFRAPHAAKFLVLPYVLGQMDKISILGDVDPEEWKRRPASAMVEAVMGQVRPGSILGFHDPAGPETLEAVDRILAWLQTEGYQVESLSALLARR